MLRGVKFQILTEVPVFRIGWCDTVQFGNDLPAFRMNVWLLASGYMETTWFRRKIVFFFGRKIDLINYSRADSHFKMWSFFSTFQALTPSQFSECVRDFGPTKSPAYPETSEKMYILKRMSAPEKFLLILSPRMLQDLKTTLCYVLKDGICFPWWNI
jgi:hypothetical protein